MKLALSHCALWFPLLVACAASKADFVTDPDDAGATPPLPPDPDASPSIHTDGSMVDSSDVACGDDVKKIFVISREKDLYRFDPLQVAMGAGAFTKVGAVSCPGAGGNPFSMAVDRMGIAWVNYDDGQVFHVRVSDASCTSTAYVPAQAPGFKNFGMAFVSNAKSSTVETLFVAADTGTGVAVIDTTSLKLTPRGSYGTAESGAELTGTGDARLFAFFSGGLAGDASLGQVDPTSGTLSGLQTLSGLHVGTDYAYAFWGGTFWLFTNGVNVNDPQLSNGSFVNEYDYGTQVLTQRAKDLGFDIVGAGVSTCAPLVKPTPS